MSAEDEPTDWGERVAAGEHPSTVTPSPVLEASKPSIPDSRALNVATGTGRNAVALAAAGRRQTGTDTAAREPEHQQAIVPASCETS